MILESVTFLDSPELEAIEPLAAGTGQAEREDELALGVECAWPLDRFQL